MWFKSVLSYGLYRILVKLRKKNVICIRCHQKHMYTLMQHELFKNRYN